MERRDLVQLFNRHTNIRVDRTLRVPVAAKRVCGRGNHGAAQNNCHLQGLPRQGQCPDARGPRHARRVWAFAWLCSDCSDSQLPQL